SVPVDAWIQHVERVGAAQTRSADEHAIGVDALDIPRLNAAMDFSWVPVTRRNVDRGTPASASEALDRVPAAHQRLASAGAFGNGLDAPDARLSRLLDS